MSCEQSKRTIDGRELKPESLMMSYGYVPEWSEGALKCPIFQTSTFVFESAEAGKEFFEVAYDLREKDPAEELGLIYSRLNNPDLEILEDRLSVWDDAEACAMFESGMAAINTVFFEFLRPGDVILHSEPVYGGTDFLLKNVLERFNIDTVGFPAHCDKEEVREIIADSGREEDVTMIFVETPANPTLDMVDIEMCSDLASELSEEPENKVITAVDNTFMGPLWQHPLDCGADLVLYSATKYIGGHSDVIAGACLGPEYLMERVQTLRTFMGTMGGPYTGWLLLRSLETLKLRMEKQMENAQHVADFLSVHPKVEQVHYPGLLEEDDPGYRVYQKQCIAPGAMVSFSIVGGEEEAFTFLNSLELFHLAVSLGGTESLAEHPATMTHADVSPEKRRELNITDELVRLSIGVENKEDMILDLRQGLESVK